MWCERVPLLGGRTRLADQRALGLRADGTGGVVGLCEDGWMSASVEIQGLIKTFGAVRAVDGVDLNIDAGAFVGLVGHNGAGKTTTMRMLTAQLTPTEGQLRVAGVDVVADPQGARALMGVVPEHPALYDYLSAEEMIAFVAEIRGGGDVAWALEVAGLGRDAKRLIREYSQGLSLIHI